MITKTGSLLLGGLAGYAAWKTGLLKPVAAVGSRVASTGASWLGRGLYGGPKRLAILGIPATFAVGSYINDGAWNKGINYVDPRNNQYRLKPGVFTNSIVKNQ